MDALPDLDLLNVAEKDQVIHDLWSLVGSLSVALTTLPKKVEELTARLVQNSRNSSKLPSSDGLDKHKPKSLRKAGERPSGGQQKISGCFRTMRGADTCCTLRSYLATLHKQSAKLFQVLTLTFQGSPPQPRFA
ncbi:DUF6444 domain-containing protein [Candidatus Accumulibacter phosphatis]|uniref:DUF6444 domain-containing protein n=1 Tax=Candidatus Accumulibacter phosphatis TaxID=327160 RepID=UPI00110C08C6